jgi:phospholipase/carboxylesterase
MAISAADYRAIISAQEEKILVFLRAFEWLQEHMHLGQIKQAKQDVFDRAGGDVFPPLNAELEGLEAPDGREAFHKKWLEALEQLEDAYTSFLTGSEANFIVAYMQSRRAFSLGKYVLYELRAELPKLREYWVLPDALARWDELETPVAGVEAQTGVIHRPSTDKHAEYSLYVPEYYDPSRSWPLVITLHGGHGRGDDYLLTWLRAAKSAGYIVLSPKSLGGTWSLQRPGVDIRSILSMVETLLDEYSIDIGRLFATGLSDGGSFSYALGLSCPKLFAGAAPIAAAGMIVGMFNLDKAKDLPIYIVHGGKDFMFPVATAQMAYELLQKSAFTKVKYEELPDWGHAYTYSINDTLVLPWFNSLPSRQPQAKDSAED